MTPPDDVPRLIRALPLGSTTGTAHGSRWTAVRHDFSEGRAIKLVAEELGGTGYISLNLYDLTSGPRLFPCEMPSARVIDFLRSFVPDPRTV